MQSNAIICLLFSTLDWRQFILCRNYFEYHLLALGLWKGNSVHLEMGDGFPVFIKIEHFKTLNLEVHI